MTKIDTSKHQMYLAYRRVLFHSYRGKFKIELNQKKRTKRKPKENYTDYINWKGYYSINTQAVCDNNY